MKEINKEFNKEKEFEEALQTYGALITKICFYYSSDLEEFKDLRQEIMINIWKGWAHFRNDSKLSTWIYRICLNTCISFQRKEKKSKSPIHLNIDAAINLPTEEDADILEKYRVMHSLIQKLSFEDRAIILMWLDEKSYDEIATIIGVNRNTLAVRLKRIKEKLVKMNQ